MNVRFQVLLYWVEHLHTYMSIGCIDVAEVTMEFTDCVVAMQLPCSHP